MLLSILTATLLWADLVEPLRLGRARGDLRLRRDRLDRRLPQGGEEQPEGPLGEGEILLAVADRRSPPRSTSPSPCRRRRSGQILDLFSAWVASGFSMTLARQGRPDRAVLQERRYPLGVFGFILLSYFVIVGTSNAVNLTDGLDGLAIMPAVMVAGGLAVFAMVTGRVDYSRYLLFPYIPARRSSPFFAVRSSARASASSGSTPTRPTCSWATWARFALGAALGTVARDRPAGDRAFHHGRRVRRGNRLGDDPGPRISSGAAASAFSEWRRFTTTTSCRDGRSLRWSSASGSSP